MQTPNPRVSTPYDRTDRMCAIATNAARDLEIRPEAIVSISIYPGTFVPTRAPVCLHVDASAFDRLEEFFADDPDYTLTGPSIDGNRVSAIYTLEVVAVEILAIYDEIPEWVLRAGPDDLIAELPESVLAGLAERGPGRFVRVAGGYRWVGVESGR